jgi:hypothetical protein
LDGDLVQRYGEKRALCFGTFSKVLELFLELFWNLVLRAKSEKEKSSKTWVKVPFKKTRWNRQNPHGYWL